MKKLVFFVLVALVLIACEPPVEIADIIVGDPVYVPPPIEGAKEINVLRVPDEYVAKSARGLIAQSDPLIGECTEPGTVYMFYDDNALVQYVPYGNESYPQLANTAKLTVELHNSTSPVELWWDYISVSAPGFVFDTSHDPPSEVLTVRFLNNDGTLHVTNGNTYNIVASSPEEYATWAYPDGRPRPILKLDFSANGAEDGVSVIHMQLGGDGLDIPAATFHY